MDNIKLSGVGIRSIENAGEPVSGRTTSQTLMGLLQRSPDTWVIRALASGLSFCDTLHYIYLRPKAEE